MNENQSKYDVGVDVARLRREHDAGPLKRKDLHSDPFRQFQAWFALACDSDVLIPNAMSLATIDADDRPALRTVLLKYFDERGFVFFTNLGSAKAEHISRNANVALLFHWPHVDRQISIRGPAEKLPASEVLKYFLTRPRGSQIGAWVSYQSHAVSTRAVLEEKFAEMKQKFSKGEVPLPSFWGGYRVSPINIEFWQGQPNRLHDRFQYTKQQDDTWEIERLQP